MLQNAEMDSVKKINQMWYYDKKDLKKTPSVADSLSLGTEQRYRRDGARFIIKVGTRMGLRYDTMATGVVYFHRFYMFHSFRTFPRFVTACCCLFLAGKVEETPKKCKDIIKNARGYLTDTQFAQFGEDPKEEVMTLERILLQTIKFDLQVDHPYGYLLRYAKLLKGDKAKLQKLVQMAWTFVNDSLCTTLSLQWEPEIIAIALMYLASKLSKFEITDWQGKSSKHTRWWDMFVDDMSTELLEDICHQVLDLYSSPVPTSPQDSPPSTPTTPRSVHSRQSQPVSPSQGPSSLCVSPQSKTNEHGHPSPGPIIGMPIQTITAPTTPVLVGLPIPRLESRSDAIPSLPLQSAPHTPQSSQPPLPPHLLLGSGGHHPMNIPAPPLVQEQSLPPPSMLQSASQSHAHAYAYKQQPEEHYRPYPPQPIGPPPPPPPPQDTRYPPPPSNYAPPYQESRIPAHSGPPPPNSSSGSYGGYPSQQSYYGHSSAPLPHGGHNQSYSEGYGPPNSSHSHHMGANQYGGHPSHGAPPPPHSAPPPPPHGAPPPPHGALPLHGAPPPYSHDGSNHMNLGPGPYRYHVPPPDMPQSGPGQGPTGIPSVRITGRF